MDLDARHMDPETACLSCHGTGTILAPYDPRPGYPAHAYLIVCGCGVYIERYPNAMNYQTGQTLPWTTHKQVMARAAGYVAWVDEPLRADIERLWEAGIGTFTSCQGEGEGRWIIVSRKSDAAAARGLLPWVTNVYERERDAFLEEKARYDED